MKWNFALASLLILNLCLSACGISTEVSPLNAGAGEATPDDTTPPPDNPDPTNPTHEGTGGAYATEPASLLPPMLLSSNSGLAQNITSNALDLSWRATGVASDRLVLQRKLNAGAFTTIATLSGTASSYHDAGLTPGSQYEYRLQRQAGGMTDGNYVLFLGIRTRAGGDNAPRPPVKACTTLVDAATSLQKTLANSKPGDVICLTAGMHIVYGTDTTLLPEGRNYYGEAGATLARPNATSPVVALGSNSILNGITFTGQGLVVKSAQNSQVNECQFNAISGNAVTINGGSNLRFEGNLMNTITYGFYLQGALSGLEMDWNMADGVGASFFYGANLASVSLGAWHNRLNSWKPAANVKHIGYYITSLNRGSVSLADSAWLGTGLAAGDDSVGVYFNGNGAYIHGNSIMNYKTDVVVDGANSYEISYSNYCGATTFVSYINGAHVSNVVGLTETPSCQGVGVPNNGKPGI